MDLDAGTVRVRQSLQRIDGKLQLVDPNTERSRRTIPLPDICVVALREHQAQQDAEAAASYVWLNEWDLVFTTNAGTPIEPRNLLRHFQGVCAANGLPHLRFHDLRHTCASLLLAQGVEPRVIMETLGHSVIGTTMNLYAHVLPAPQRTAADRMDDLLRRSSGSSEPRGSSRGSRSPVEGNEKTPPRMRKGR